MKWLSAIFEGIVGFVIWSFVGLWIGIALAMAINTCVTLSGTTPQVICLAPAAAVGLFMAIVYARRAFNAHEGRGNLRRDSFMYMLTFALYALAWSFIILFVQLGKNH